MILCFYRQKVESFREKHKIIDVPFFFPRLCKCQLGLFGYAPENKIIKSLDIVDPELEQAINETKKENVIQCSQIWEIAKKLGMRKHHVSCACETLKLKIKGCQLGAF
jgi:hypothetical protein